MPALVTARDRKAGIAEGGRDLSVDFKRPADARY
jgi:hypothetical protein